MFEKNIFTFRLNIDKKTICRQNMSKCFTIISQTYYPAMGRLPFGGQD